MSEPTSQLGNLKILIVDDAEESRFLLERALKPLGARVDGAEDGLEGVTKALRERYDVILMDLRMPILDGLQATLHLRKCGFSGRIVACSSFSPEADELEKSGQKIFDDYFPKPIDVTSLTRRLRRIQLMKELSDPRWGS